MALLHAGGMLPGALLGGGAGFLAGDMIGNMGNGERLDPDARMFNLNVVGSSLHNVAVDALQA